MIFAALFELVMTQNFHRKFAQNYRKFTKKVKTISFGADLLQDENIDHAEKKAQNSDAERGRLHVEI